jgi:aspartyl/glutamyl-tRNA(Asn/Gln) amidotransferase C subunit
MEDIDIKKLSSLARLKVSPLEEESLVKDLQSILGYVSQIKNVAELPPEERLEQHRNIFREDILSPIEPEVIRQAFAAREGDYLKVQKVIDPK